MSRAGPSASPPRTEVVPVPLFDATVEGRVRWSNEAFRKLFGRERGSPPDLRELHVMPADWDSAVLEAKRIGTIQGRGAYLWLPAHDSPRWVAFDFGFVEGSDGCESLLTGAAHDLSVWKEREQCLRRQLFHDSLTGLPNRALFLENLHQALRGLSRRGEGYIGVAFIDLDGFKEVNDTRGHVFGDQVLIQVAKRLRTCVRPGDLVARLGGDEFVVLLRNLKVPVNRTLLTARLHQVLAEPVRAGGFDASLTASVGVAETDDPACTPDRLLRGADAAMYREKFHRRRSNRGRGLKPRPARAAPLRDVGDPSNCRWEG